MDTVSVKYNMEIYEPFRTKVIDSVKDKII